MAKKPPGRTEHLRSAIAQEAARLMAEHGIHDFGVAKRKAAERYGLPEGSVLPRNVEIEAALIARQRLFGAAAHATSLERQRRVALVAMKTLQEFQPRLVGPVLTGSATQYADIQLHVFADTAESVYIEFMDRHAEHEVIHRKVKMTAERQLILPGLRFEVDEESVEVVIFPRDGIRQAPVSPVDGRPMRRADSDEVRALLLNPSSS
ncbi:MAG: hypothetical protein ABIT36_06335 [Steroidobacteraceae bacterium]